MESTDKTPITWNNASDDWYTPRAENDLRRGGHFNFRMEARDIDDYIAGFPKDIQAILEKVRATIRAAENLEKARAKAKKI